ncbi:MAG: protein phosphatase 2C domain-containing protein [Pseudomonadota bacterium]
MRRKLSPRFDVASALSQGRRDYQEDALVTDFPVGEDIGLVVLADGMGGHAAGDVASKIVVTEVYGMLKRQSTTFLSEAGSIPARLTSAAAKANASVRDHVKAQPERAGMGATLVSLVLRGAQMYWTSIGDSPLYLMRKGKLLQLNEDHSMAPQIDMMVKAGMLDAEAGRTHPDRNCLTSAILGDTVSRVDCPDDPFGLETGDIVVVSSDGLQFLEESDIQRLIHKNRRRTASEIAAVLLTALEGLSEPDQDNISFSVIKVNHTDDIRTDPIMAMPRERSRSTTRLLDGSKLADYASGLFGSGKKEASSMPVFMSNRGPAPNAGLAGTNEPRATGT